MYGDKPDKVIANTIFVKASDYYKGLLMRYRLLKVSIYVLIGVAIISCLVLVARPVSYNRYESNEAKRDIFLCMDISGSMDSINAEITSALIEIVKELKGDRFGLVIFNSSPVQAIPLTDDYEYVISYLNKLNSAFRAENGKSPDDKYTFTELYDFQYQGTSEGVGASVMSDGLAACALDFVDLEDVDRSRIIIFSTDNLLNGDYLFTMEEATDLCKDKNIKVYTVCSGFVENEATFKKQIEKTGGKFYKVNDLNAIGGVVKEVSNLDKTIVDTNVTISKVDMPQIPYIILLISITLLLILLKRVDL